MNIVNTMLWMKKNAYEETTIRKVAKLLRHLQRNCNTKDTETVKLYIAKKTTSNGHKENLVEAYAINLRSQNLTWEQPFYQRYDKKRRPPKEELIDFLISHARLEMALKLSMTKDLGEARALTATPTGFCSCTKRELQTYLTCILHRMSCYPVTELASITLTFGSPPRTSTSWS